MKAILVPPGLPGKTVDISATELEHELGFVAFAYPFDDPVCLAHDDDGIANHRPPNRTINGNIMPGPFYVLGMSSSGQLTDLSPEMTIKYLHHFTTPEYFPSGRWLVTTKTAESSFGAVVFIESAWVTSDD